MNPATTISPSSATGVAPPSHWVDVGAGAKTAPPSKRWLRTAYVVAEVLFETSDGPPPPERLAWLCHELDDMDSNIKGMGFVVIKLALFLANWIAPLYVGSLPTFRRLPFEKRRRALHRFEAGIFGLTIFAVKALCCLLWFEHPDVAQEVRFDGQCLSGAGGSEVTT